MALPLILIFTAKSGAAAHPSAEVSLPTQFKVIGGGASINWSGAGNLLTASYPSSKYSWFAAGKDHEVSCPAQITAYAIAIYDPKDEWETNIVSKMSGDPVSHPQVTATLPEGYVLTGGGARVDWNGAGNLLTASFPGTDRSWEARSKDHDVADPARISAFAIGLRRKSGLQPVNKIFQSIASNPAAHPSAQIAVGSGWALSGGGAFDQWNGAGNLLTASFPHRDSAGKLHWDALGKDHQVSSPASMVAYAVGIRES